MRRTLMDRTVGFFSPRGELNRLRARMARDLVLSQLRHYEGAATGRRTQGWNRSSTDANAANQIGLGRLRDQARDLVRNNGHMASALRTIANHTVGCGIVAKTQNAAALALWKQWAETTACDADGRDDFAGLEKLVVTSVARDGEVLVRRRIRRLDDGFPIPLQLQVLEADFLDTSKTMALPSGGFIIQGVEFDPLGRRVAYWLFTSHPGATLSTNASQIFGTSRRIDASEILHIFQRDRAGQVRAVSWFAPILLTARELDEYGDAQLMKQKIAACLAVIQTDVNGDGRGLGDTDDTKTPRIDELQPGAIITAEPGRSIEVVQPPTVGDYDPFVKVENRKLAKGMGLSYEDFTGDYSNVNFSSARMARIEHYDNVHDWRWRLTVPQFCGPAWQWAMYAAALAGKINDVPVAEWVAPPMPFIEPDKEGLAIQRNVRNGLQSWSDAVRERGYDPQALLDEIQKDNEAFDEREIVLDVDPRKMTQAGQLQGSEAAKSVTAQGGAAS
jgi:lambda family phage portal protein